MLSCILVLLLSSVGIPIRLFFKAFLHPITISIIHRDLSSWRLRSRDMGSWYRCSWYRCRRSRCRSYSDLRASLKINHVLMVRLATGVSCSSLCFDDTFLKIKLQLQMG